MCLTTKHLSYDTDNHTTTYFIRSGPNGIPFSKISNFLSILMYNVRKSITHDLKAECMVRRPCRYKFNNTYMAIRIPNKVSCFSLLIFLAHESTHLALCLPLWALCSMSPVALKHHIRFDFSSWRKERMLVSCTSIM